MKQLFLGGYGAGITTLGEDLRPVGHTPFAAPSFLAAHPSLPVLYAVGEHEEGRLGAFTRSAAGLTPAGERSSGGSLPCHLAVHPSGRLLAVANYGDGTVSLHRLDERGGFDGEPILLRHEGSGPVADRQERSHAHQAVFHDDVLHVSDLGTDEIRRYGLDGRALEPVRLAPGFGPRHFAFDGTTWHVAGELDGTVRAYDASWLETARARASEGQPNHPSHLEVSGGLVYVANRGPDTISVLRAGSLEKVAEVPCGGRWPRHFALAGDRLLVANQHSGGVAVLPLEDGIPGKAEHVIDAESPACVLKS